MNEATDKVSLPGTVLAASGAFSLAFGLLMLTLQLVSIVPGMLDALSNGYIVDWLMAMMLSQIPSLVFSFLGLAGAVVTIVAGMRLRSLSSPSLVYAGAIMAMLPCCSPCCPIGLLTGGWALFVMQDDEVRAAMADA